jgi:hypothetical protein
MPNILIQLAAIWIVAGKGIWNVFNLCCVFHSILRHIYKIAKSNY